ncbi:uncharacterized protein LOC26534998 [Drosophila yakuba]|uniref:BPTI/Kunitz inhibitor domain-containing protein n=1 Tax=Drosophila yakuba TaxID=7245 RepID=A0A0R1DJ67_DROYA|nr:uncharacterized protein LOC26534998 [Drosophila yakuba]XP_039491524.1 uncharacterized protein LOC120451693 [Drosophila santomea]KRJ97231.1 uncharacterized protein Dyak_GE27817 [Drosophila yakuba]
MKIYLFILSLALWLLNILALKDPICGQKTKVNKCIVLGKESPVFYGYNETSDECYKIKNPCQKSVRRFATKAICEQICQEK